MKNNLYCHIIVLFLLIRKRSYVIKNLFFLLFP